MTTRPKHPPAVYVVAWEADLIIKNGYSTAWRWLQFVQRGATLLRLYEFQLQEDRLAFNFEQQLDDLAGYQFSRAFDTRAESIPWLGGTGEGYRECFQLAEPADLTAWKEVLPSSAYQALIEAEEWTGA